MKRLGVLILILFLTGCSEEAVKENTKDAKAKSGDYTSDTLEGQEKSGAIFQTVSSAEAIELIESGSVQIIDVRSPDGYEESHIPNARNIPLKDLETNKTILDKNESYLIVCKVGKTSEVASKLLAEKGYENIYNLSNGMDGWTGEVENQE